MYSLAIAAAIGFLANSSGGEIVLTDNQVPECDGYIGAAYSTSPTNETLPGCWTYDGRMVHIKWILPSGRPQFRSYKPDEFTKVEGA